MLPQNPRLGRRRPQYTPRTCALSLSLLLLLLSVYLLYSLLLLHSSPLSPPLSLSSHSLLPDPLLDEPDPDPDPTSHSTTSLDLIDELDDPSDPSEEDDDDDYTPPSDPSKSPKYTFDHSSGSIRRPFDRRSIDQWEDYAIFGKPNEPSAVVFGSDDVAVDEEIRRKVAAVRVVEDVLLLKGSGLREGWGPWFEAKSDFLRRDKMFRSNLEGLNPLNNPLLQDPDGVGLTGVSKGDRVVMKGILSEFKKVPFLVKKPLGLDEGSEIREKNSDNDREVGGVKKTVKSSENGLEDLGRKGREIASMKKPLKCSDNGEEDLSGKGREIESMEKHFLFKDLEKSVEDLTKKGREVGSMKKPIFGKSLENGVEELSRKGREIVSMREPLVIKSLESSVEDMDRNRREIARMKKPLVISDLTHELQLKSKDESKEMQDGVEDSRVIFKTEEISSQKKPLVIKDSTHELGSKSKSKYEMMGDGKNKLLNMHSSDVNVEHKLSNRRALHENAGNFVSGTSSKQKATNVSNSNKVQSVGSKNANSKIKQGLSREVYANGKRWGYFPGLHPRLSFSKFMDAFFKKYKCSTRVFMVWNSAPWAFTVRHQRGLESLLYHHPDACLVVFSETIELNFFERFVKDGFKIAVSMPNLDELLKDTPTHIFASVWFEWRKATFYSTHYSELIRLAALYKYGGIYLDSDVILLKPLSSFSNSVGLVDLQAGISLNGAVMSFKKHSSFIMECLTEFYSTYDDTKLRWNGADLLTRVANNFSRNMDVSGDKMELKLQHSSLFFPISHDDITRYFFAPETETERAEQNRLYKKILKESFTFHFWNSLTSALVPDPDSLVAKIINQNCIRCDDVL